ncbi:MAG: riboflavin synthase [Polyangiaceae bacterium]
MFSGLVQATGTIAARSARGPGLRLAISADLGELTLGESVAVSGVCLTVVTQSARGFEADVSAETVERTTLGTLASGARVNLERALALGDRLGGHLVQGHVDGVARVERSERVGDALRVVVRPPAELVRFIAPKGSICLDGVSLTVNVCKGGVFEVMLIPETLERTTLAGIGAGRELNLEVDLLARYAVHWLESTSSAGASGGLESALARAGFMSEPKV